MALTDQNPIEQHATEHPLDPHRVDPHGVDPYGVEREPSADWGWHDTPTRAGKIAGWFTAFALFAMLIGNHRSRVEDVYLIGLGTILVVMLIASHLKARKAKRR